MKILKRITLIILFPPVLALLAWEVCTLLIIRWIIFGNDNGTLEPYCMKILDWMSKNLDV